MVFSDLYPEAKLWQIVALIEKEIRHPLAEILYKEAFTRCEIVGTNYGFILLEKPQVQKEGLTARVLDKAEKREMSIFLGNKHLLKNNGIELPLFDKTADAATEIFLATDNQALLVFIP